MPKRERRAVDGVLLLDKPLGLTSNAALTRAKRLLGAAKAGHTGTLDPLATGLLPLCFGEATKFAAFGLDADKTYEAVVALGAATTTGDAEGQVIHAAAPGDASERLDEVLAQFTGRIQQRPPMFSALKHQGRPLYEYARTGQTIDRAPREVTVHELAVIERAADEVRIRVRASKGTYIRALAHDLGERLGCGAHLKGLRRVAIGALQVSEAIGLEALESATPEDRSRALRPVDFLVSDLPRIYLDSDQAAALCQGRSVAFAGPDAGGVMAVYEAPGAFLGIGELRSPGRLFPLRLLASSPARGRKPLGLLEEKSVSRLQ